MFLSTLLSALPLLNPALPVQEPTTKSGQTCTCSKQEPVAKTKTAKKAVFAKVSVNRGKATQQVQGKTNKTTQGKANSDNKAKSQRILRKTLQTHTQGGSNRSAWKLAKIETVNPDEVATWGVHEGNSTVSALGSVGRNSGTRAIWGHHDDDSSVAGLGTVTEGNVIVWGQHDSAPGMNRLGQVTKNQTKAKKAKTATQQKKANKKNKGQKKTRKNR